MSYWVQLGGRPGRPERRKVWEALARGLTLGQVKGSIAELVREDRIKAGLLAEGDPWPPESIADRGPPAAGGDELCNQVGRCAITCEREEAGKMSGPRELGAGP